MGDEPAIRLPFRRPGSLKCRSGVFIGQAAVPGPWPHCDGTDSEGVPAWLHKTGSRCVQRGLRNTDPGGVPGGAGWYFPGSFSFKAEAASEPSIESMRKWTLHRFSSGASAACKMCWLLSNHTKTHGTLIFFHGTLAGGWSCPRSWSPLAGVRVGEARKPGPGMPLDDPEADLWEDESQPDDDFDAEMWCSSRTSQADGQHPAARDSDDDRSSTEMHLAWGGDMAFSDEQLLAWRNAESAAGLSMQRNVSKHKKSLRSPQLPEAQSSVEGFISRRTFAGHLRHFEFKTGSRGTGYYDTRVQADGLAFADAPHPVVLDRLIPPAGNQGPFCL